MRRFDPSPGFALIRDSIVDTLAPDEPLIVAIDDTIVRKAGTKTHGSKWRRDPLGPPFQVNLIRAQRFLQLSAALTFDKGSTRMLPIDRVHAPGRPKTDDPTLTEVAVERIGGPSAPSSTESIPTGTFGSSETRVSPTKPCSKTCPRGRL